MKFIFAFIITTVICGTVKQANLSNGCPKNAEYRECTNMCPEKSCSNYLTVSGCFSLRCNSPACVCKEGHVLLNADDKSQGCVKRETCSRLEKIRKAESKLTQTPISS